LTILHTVKSDDCVSLETEMHRKFKHLNIKDEWFEYHDEVLEFIDSLRLDYGLNKNRLEKTRTDKIKKDKYTAPIHAELLSDYMKIRKAKKAGELTETAFKGIEREALKAGITTEQAIQICCERGWVGFKAEWFVDKQKTKPSFQDNREAAARTAFGSLLDHYMIEEKAVGNE